MQLRHKSLSEDSIYGLIDAFEIRAADARHEGARGRRGEFKHCRAVMILAKVGDICNCRRTTFTPVEIQHIENLTWEIVCASRAKTNEFSAIEINPLILFVQSCRRTA